MIFASARIWQLTALAVAMSLLHPAAQARAAEAIRPDWSQWRGPTRDGKYVGPAWPDALTDGNLRQLWRVPLAPSYSGPLVVGDRVFTTETIDKKTEVVSALDRATGKVLWSVRWDGALKVPFFAASNGDWIRATPACDGEFLYVAGMRDVLVCLRAADGAEQWRVDFVEEFKSPLPAFGFVSSPLVTADHVFVQAGAAVIKLDKRTGKVLWRSLEDAGGMWGSAFSSPTLADVAGVRQLLVQSREKLAGLDPQTGRVLWSQEVPAFRGMNILTPTVVGDTIFASSYGGKSLLYRLTAAKDKWEVSEAWTNKTQGYMSSPVVVGGYAYLHLRNQRFTCLDLATGEEKWTTKPFGKYWSLVTQGDKILALDERGELLLIRANPEKFDLLGSRKVAEAETWAHLAVSGEQIFVRELNALTAWEWK